MTRGEVRTVQQRASRTPQVLASVPSRYAEAPYHRPTPDTPLALPLWPEVIAIGAGAAFGGSSAVRQLLGGSGVLAVSLGLGSRRDPDILLQQGPPAALIHSVSREIR